MFFGDVFRLLNRRRVSYIIVGGLASVLHGMVRMTADLDLMIDLGEKNIVRFLSGRQDENRTHHDSRHVN